MTSTAFRRARWSTSPSRLHRTPPHRLFTFPGDLRAASYVQPGATLQLQRRPERTPLPLLIQLFARQPKWLKTWHETCASDEDSGCGDRFVSTPSPRRLTSRAEVGTFTGRPFLLELPNELIAQIAWEVAPLGGGRVGNLRLVNSRICTIASPILFSSIQLTEATQRGYNSLESAIRNDQMGVRKAATSIRYDILAEKPLPVLGALVNIERVSLTISPYGSSIPPVVRDSFFELPRLHVLALKGLRIPANDCRTFIEEYAPGVRHLILDGVKGPGLFATSKDCEPGGQGFRCSDRVKVEVLEVFNEHWDVGYYITPLCACSRTVRRITINSSLSPERTIAFPEHVSFPVAEELHLRGLHCLFNVKRNSRVHMHTTISIVSLLNAVGAAHLFELSLPVYTTFDLHNRIFSISMPHVRTLKLARFSLGKSAEEDLERDLFTDKIITSLRRFLLASSSPMFPSLKTLHLVGWIDPSRLARIFSAAPASNIDGEIVESRALMKRFLQILESRGVVHLVLEGPARHSVGAEKYYLDYEKSTWMIRRRATVW
ncbi:hypothetical protein P7C70_g7060, partial [Phenoliferia sp. Uapishka_3]